MDNSEEGLWSSIFRDATNELWSNPVPHSKEKHEEDSGLQRRRNRNSNLSDQDTRQQRGGDRSETEAAELEFAEKVTQREREKDGDLRVLAEGCCEPGKHV